MLPFVLLKRLAGIIAAAVFACLLISIAILISITIGEVLLPVDSIFKVLANHCCDTDYPLSAIDAGIIWNYRLPRAMIAAAVGAGLAVCGVLLQALLGNALAEPYLLGVSAGASAGAVAVTILGLGGGMIGLSAGAFLGAAAAFMTVIFLIFALGGNGSGRQKSVQIILAGIAVSQLFNALSTFMITKSANADQARGIIFWLLGNLSGVRWEDVWLALPVALAGVVIAMMHARSLDAFVFGAEAAAAVGVVVQRVFIVLVGAMMLMTAIFVSMVGAIGFVGLVIPHAARFLVGGQHDRLLPLVAVSGAVFLVLADLFSRIVIPGQVLPIGVVTALVGAPVFALILVRGQR